MFQALPGHSTLSSLGPPGPVSCLCPSVHELIQCQCSQLPCPSLSQSSSPQLSPSVYLLKHAGAQLLKRCWRKSLILLQVYNHTPRLGVPVLLLQEACVPTFRKFCFDHSLSLNPYMPSSLCSVIDRMTQSSVIIGSVINLA